MQPRHGRSAKASAERLGARRRSAEAVALHRSGNGSRVMTGSAALIERDVFTHSGAKESKIQSGRTR
jgi:hypothetical protein